MSTPSIAFIQAIPKAELHVHIEGTLEPELLLKLGKRNKVSLPFQSVDEIQAAYNFNSLQSFLDIYYQTSRVLLYEQDFYDLMYAYLQKAVTQGVRYAEIFFDPQTHTQRGVAFDVFMKGFTRAMADGRQRLGIRAQLIMCFLRDLSEEDAIETLAKAMPYQQHILAVGLDSAEKGHPPEKFARVFEDARQHGFFTVAHAGETGPAEYIWQALTILKVSRIDHGVHCVEDSKLIKYLADEQIPLTMCPLSNVRLNVTKELAQHPLKQLLDLGLCVTINSDDPPFFDGYIVENFVAAKTALYLSSEDIYKLAKNSFAATFLSQNEKRKYLDELEAFYMQHSGQSMAAVSA